MRTINTAVLCLAAILASTPLTNASPAVKINSKRAQPSYVTHQDRADAVKEAFQFAWDGYYKYAFPNDDLQPVDNTFSNPRNGWGASAVDALSTAIIMELPEVVNQIIKHVPTIKYDQTSTEVSLFETTIRYLGGMLAGYDLLTGPFNNLAIERSVVPSLLAQSERLASELSFAFNTPSGVPVNDLSFTEKGFVPGSGGINGLATAGTLVLEWTRLADLTGNATYAQLTQKAESYLLNPQPPQNQPFPGLVGSGISVQNGEFVDAAGGWQGGDDSFYEYLIKMWVYDSSRFGNYKDRWIAAADSSIQYLASKPNSRPDLTFLSQYDNKTLMYESEHLACFDGGNFILGGLVLQQQKYVDFGVQLTKSCYDTYSSTATHIGPEAFAWLPSSCKTQSQKRHGPDMETEDVEVASVEQQIEFNETLCTSSSCEETFSSIPQSGLDISVHGDWSFPWFANAQQSTLTASARRATSTRTVTSIVTVTGAPPGYASKHTRTATTTVAQPPPSSSLPSPSSSAPPAPATSCTLPSQYASQQSFYDEHGFYITNPTYDLRPEVLESVYYAYRATGDPMYQDWAWDAFKAINSTCRVGSGFSQIADVTVKGGGGFANNQESFFFAELMKYLYLIQSRDGEWQVNFQGKNNFVFNTEAHPMRVKGNPI